MFQFSKQVNIDLVQGRYQIVATAIFRFKRKADAKVVQIRQSLPGLHFCTQTRCIYVFVQIGCVIRR
jgi:hypothetical protein